MLARRRHRASRRCGLFLETMIEREKPRLELSYQQVDGLTDIEVRKYLRA